MPVKAKRASEVPAVFKPNFGSTFLLYAVVIVSALSRENLPSAHRRHATNEKVPLEAILCQPSNGIFHKFCKISAVRRNNSLLRYTEKLHCEAYVLHCEAISKRHEMG